MSSSGEKWGCYIFGIKTGIKSLLKGHCLIGLKQLLFPISYWRFPVFNITLDNIERKNNIKILDIGSPKLLSLYLSIKHGDIVFATDLQDQEIFYRYYKHFLDHQPCGKYQYTAEYQDARVLNYPDEYFDAVYSISVFEHIPDDGDKKAAREVGRVLKKKGIAIIEVPFADTHRNEYVRSNIYERQYLGEPVFYQRHYNEESIIANIIKESKLELIKAIITIEKVAFMKYWSRVPKYFRTPFLLMEPLFSVLNHNFYTLQSWQEMKKTNRAEKEMNITLVLRKS